MIFDTLKEKCEYYRNLADDRFIPNMPLLVMVDGRSFSSLVKKRFNLPFDEDFVAMMNDVAMTLCKEIQGCKFAYVQSDEISLFIDDNFESDSYFGWRKCKLLSIIASIASARMTHLFALYATQKLINTISHPTVESLLESLKTSVEVQFDCKCWNVPNYNEVFAWFLYRQNDCVRNSKQQVAQTYLPNKSLNGLNTDEQIKKLKEEKGIDWNGFEPSVKYGRLVYNQKKEKVGEDGGIKIRPNWIVMNCPQWKDEENREFFDSLIN